MTERKRNQYGGPCRKCGNWVEELAGFRLRLDGRWKVEHDGECPPRVERAVTPRTPRAPKANQYGGPCAFCGKDVPVAQGRLTGTRGAWKAAHLTPADCEAAPAAPAPKAPAPEFPVPLGYYAIPSRKGNDLDFFCIKAGKGKWKGRTFVNEVIGGRVAFGVRLSRDEQTAVVEGILAVGIEAARKRYADEIGNCWSCNSLLTDDESRTLGIGPVCRKKLERLAVPEKVAA